MERVIRRYILESFLVRYRKAGKKEKGDLLGEICLKFACHRKHAIRLLGGAKRVSQDKPKKRGRKSLYASAEFLSALHLVRRIMEFRNAEVIKLNMAEWVPFIEKHHGKFPIEIRGKLLKISAASMKRIFQRMREQASHGLSTTRPPTILRTEIPIRTEPFSEESMPGKMAADTVAHCGDSTQGQYINSLDMVCPVTHWTAQRATWGKGSSDILEQTKDIEKSLPFKMIGLHVDNGSEFLNYAYVRHFISDLRQRFEFTRSRAYRKNDNCHVEQKNWSVVRRYLGYDRLDVIELVPLINDLYKNELCLYLNHFCRTFKLDRKVAVKSRYRRIYGEPLTPYQRVLNSPHIDSYVKNRLILAHSQLDPVLLRKEIERKLKLIFAVYKKFTMQRKLNSVA